MKTLSIITLIAATATPALANTSISPSLSQGAGIQTAHVIAGDSTATIARFQCMNEGVRGRGMRCPSR